MVQPVIDPDSTRNSTGREAEALLDRWFPRRDLQRVLLVNPPDIHAEMFQFETARRFRYSSYPPYGLAVLAQQSRQIGLEVRILDLNHEILVRCFETTDPAEFDFETVWQTRLAQEVADFQPDLIGVTCMFTMTHTSFRTVCLQVAQFGIPLAIGGVHVANDVERILDDIPQAHIAFLKEADMALKKFVGVVRKELPVDQLGQVILSDQAARYRFLAPCQPTAKDIDVIPAYDLLDMTTYAQYGTFGAFYHLVPAGTRCATVLSNRGCRGSCTFCSVSPFNGHGVRQRSIASVIEELVRLRDDYGIGHVMWLDDDLLKNHRRVIELFNEMVRKNLKMTWDATNGVVAASCSDEVIAAAAASGCIGLHIGMESGNPEMLRQIRKPSTVKNLLEAAEILRKYEQIFASVFVMIGFPGETMGMITDTINVARQMNLDWCSVGHLQPLPNTPIYDTMVALGLISDVGSKEARFMLGHYGKASQKETAAVLDITAIAPEATPTTEQLAEVWFYMDYQLNYHRLFAETRPTKIEQQLKQLRKVSEVLYRDHSLALYFQGYFQFRMQGQVEPQLLQRLNSQLASSSYWKERFIAFGLSTTDLETGDFSRAQKRA